MRRGLSRIRGAADPPTFAGAAAAVARRRRGRLPCRGARRIGRLRHRPDPAAGIGAGDRRGQHHSGDGGGDDDQQRQPRTGVSSPGSVAACATFAVARTAQLPDRRLGLHPARCALGRVAAGHVLVGQHPAATPAAACADAARPARRGGRRRCVRPDRWRHDRHRRDIDLDVDGRRRARRCADRHRRRGVHADEPGQVDAVRRRGAARCRVGDHRRAGGALHRARRLRGARDPHATAAEGASRLDGSGGGVRWPVVLWRAWR